ncbi:MAG: twin-arginine translocase TatA/TatE family subunit [Gemmatimonadetes bacterium]|nr:twin-arginine translocase TatA/TatE family subunit [Gemmatimonadota bacterium]
MFGNLGFGEILLIGMVILLFFGAKRIPEIAGSFGKGIKEFKKNMNDVEREIAGQGNAPRMDRIESPRPEASNEERPEPKRLM